MLVKGYRSPHRIVSLLSLLSTKSELTDRMIVGPKAFIEKTRWFRKAFGGGVRQVGPMAAAADYGLTHHFPRLAYTHQLARILADGLVKLGCKLICPTETNMVYRPLHIK